MKNLQCVKIYNTGDKDFVYSNYQKEVLNY